jgi:(1->4)-alpha-D-glucan 1-alpha-D-glucosylmutase
MLDRWEDGRIKQYLTAVGLRLRRRLVELFLKGDYIPLEALGDRGDHVIAVARVFGGDRIIAIAPRLPVGLVGGDAWLPVGRGVWGDAAIGIPAAWAAARFRNAFTLETVGTEPGNPGRLPLAAALGSCPAALLTACGEERVP